MKPEDFCQQLEENIYTGWGGNVAYRDSSSVFSFEFLSHLGWVCSQLSSWPGTDPGNAVRPCQTPRIAGRTFSRKPSARTIACLCSSCAVLIPDLLQEQLKCKALMGRPGLWMHTQIIVGLFRWWLLATVHLPFLVSEWASPLLLTLQTWWHRSAGLYLLFPQARLSEGTASAWPKRWGVSGDFLHQKLFPAYYTEI